MADFGTSHRSLQGIRQWMDGALFNPRRRLQWVVYWIVISLIVVSVVDLAFTAQFPTIYEEYRGLFAAVRAGTILLFTVEIVCRLIARPHPRGYLLTWQGVIDVVAILPAFLSLFLPIPPALTVWLRSLRLVRLFRAASLLAYVKKAQNEHLEVLARLAPYFALGLALKGALLYLEGLGLWPTIRGLETVITVTGFAIGILLSTRLGTVHARIYGFDERIENLIGSVEAARHAVGGPGTRNDQALLDWLSAIYRIIISGGHDGSGLEKANEELRNNLEGQIPAPILNAMHQGAQFLVHRVRTRTPKAYTRLLTRLTVIYTIVVIAAIPGLTGLLSALLVIYVLGGMTLIVGFMDQPFDPTEDSLINADISGLERYLVHHGYVDRQATHAL